MIDSNSLGKHVGIKDTTDYIPWTWWSGSAFIFTCFIPNWILSNCNKKTSLVQQAWREKITLCSIIVLFCLGLAFLTFGMKFVLCPYERVTNAYSYYNSTLKDTTLTWRSEILVYGKLYPFDVMNSFLSSYNISLSKDFEGANMSPLFNADSKGVCARYETFDSRQLVGKLCSVDNPYSNEPTAAIQHACIPISELTHYYKADNYLEFSWSDLTLNLNRNGTSPYLEPHLLVLSDTVIDIRPYYLLDNNTEFGDNVNLALRQTAGQDATYIFSSLQDAKTAWPCIATRYATGVISSDTMGCIAYEIIIDFFLVLVIMVMAIRYTMALVFHWVVSPRLTIPGGRSKGIFAWRSIAGGNQFPKQHRPSTSSSLDTVVASDTSSIPTTSLVEKDSRHTILFVTCYSEGEESIKNTLDSLVKTSYSKRHKLLFIVADGIITGSGNVKPTSEICRDLLTLVDCEKDGLKPSCYYEAVADGYKRINQAQVYMGHYKSVPALLIIKCGTERERLVGGNNKPGNRGKRDSQMILMTFFQRVIFYDTFSQLDYEIFSKIKKITKGTMMPDKFELVLMVDADTRVEPDSISHMVAAMNNDITLMGLCGETRIANKTESWVTAIQVFEYFISHYYAKAFESTFGGVTCLPGCFSMYRIKAPKNGGWIPVLASPDIIQEFSVTTVNTLHAKNLLLLGEDRFLSTLMLRIFPRRQMIFVPQAKCRTVVPNSFRVLLSQRRRWINSTVHNLMELALVSDLCGIACLSMQFVVVIDLISSIVLPASVILLFYFFVNLGLSDTPQYQPLFILLTTLGLPALLILLTAKKISYIFWMIIYILALPIWNFILPIYSFWHFDDFSWGETRKVNGDTRKDKNSKMLEDEENQKFRLEKNNITVQRKLWHIWEKEKLTLPSAEKLKRVIQVEPDIISEPKRTRQIVDTPPLQPLQLKKKQPLQSPPQQIHNYNIYNVNHSPQQQCVQTAKIITDYSQQPKSILSRRDQTAGTQKDQLTTWKKKPFEFEKHFSIEFKKGLYAGKE
ncbi:hypothetical protein HPULCUR_008598 [Helicostylum pulchrum]|uniref:chitin synthase n=1 Tax=Helicostylum pulchrum TaxID=562976 RepID=A0ABP9Y951_9FUNG